MVNVAAREQLRERLRVIHTSMTMWRCARRIEVAIARVGGRLFVMGTWRIGVRLALVHGRLVMRAW